MTAVKKCNCENTFQDLTYGKGMRVMNLTTKGKESAKVHRCTVCNKEH